MDAQFSVLSVPDPNEYFYCSHSIRSRKWSLLMKLVLMTDNIDAVHLIKKIIINDPEEINKQNEEGWNALMIASRNSAKCSSIEVVKLLLEAGCDPNLCDNCGRTALMLASRNSKCDSNIETVKLLLEAGCDPNLQNIYGSTALIGVSIYSKCGSNIEIVKLLLDAGCDPNLRDHLGKPALYYLLKYSDLEKNTECTEQLILASQKSIPNDGSFHYIYLTRNVNILGDYYIRILKGEIVVNKTKSARS